MFHSFCEKSFHNFFFPWGEGEEIFQLSTPVQGGNKYWNISPETEGLRIFVFLFFLSLICLFLGEKGEKRAEDRHGDRNWKRTAKDCFSTVHPVWTVETAMSSYRLKHCRCIQCMHLHKQKKPSCLTLLAFFPISIRNMSFAPELLFWWAFWSMIQKTFFFVTGPIT